MNATYLDAESKTFYTVFDIPSLNICCVNKIKKFIPYLIYHSSRQSIDRLVYLLRITYVRFVLT